MAQWRIRMTVPDGADGRIALSNALAKMAIAQPRQALHDADPAELTRDVVVELRDDGALPDLLRTLHEISPRVYISRVGQASGPVGARSAGL